MGRSSDLSSAGLALVVGLALGIACAACADPVPSATWTAALAKATAQGLSGEIGLTDRTGTLSRAALSAPGHPHRVGEVWRWASVTKQITATLVLQEVAAGHLGLDDRLASRLPGFSGPTAGQITVRMLLQHTSGLPNPDDTPTDAAQGLPSFYTRTAPSASGSGTARVASPDAFGYCAGPAKAAAGAGFSYNNCDYIVLGALLEAATGQRFADLVRTRITRPLGLGTLSLADGTTDPATMVRGRLDATHPEPSFTLATFGASGALLGDPADLMAFDRALLNGRLLGPVETGLAWTGDPALGYEALGTWAFPARLKGCAGPVRLVERRGGIGGVEVRNLIAPDIGRALVVFADRSDLDFGEIWQGRGLSFDLASAGFCHGS
jgi:CubicO group peptidase (beta-lactamase class C family)